MKKLPVYSASGKKIDEVELDKEVFEAPINPVVMHDAVKAYLAGNRAGTASTKTRNEVRGGGTKPWRQKGTGRARAGSIRSPLWKGGGVTFGPKPRDYSIALPKKIKKAALKSALASKVKDSQIIVIDKLKFKKPQTKKAQGVLKHLKVKSKATLVLEQMDDAVVKSFRNIPNACVISASQINSYFVLDNDALILTRDALESIVGALKK